MRMQQNLKKIPQCAPLIFFLSGGEEWRLFEALMLFDGIFSCQISIGGLRKIRSSSGFTTLQPEREFLKSKLKFFQNSTSQNR